MQHALSSLRRRRTAIGIAVGALGIAMIPALAQANLAGSDFQSTDGDLVHGASGHDWDNAPNLVRKDETASGTADNSFGQGTKEDNNDVTVVTGSIPPNKSDLTRFYIANEKGANDHQYMYLAWERTNTLGSANMDFEINQAAQPDLTTPGAKTLVRTAGDLLVRYDFGGSGAPVLSLVKWVTAGVGGVNSDCNSSGATVPCWGALPADDSLDGVGTDQQIDLSQAGFADGAVYSPVITDKKNPPTEPDPIAGVNLAPETFGEAAIDLTAAGVFPTGNNAVCTNFGSAYLKSRASDSFTAETKDFVPPATISINNCGNLIIRKITIGGTGTFSYTTSTLPGGGFDLTTLAANTPVSKTYSGILAGTYDAAETVPAGWTLTSSGCDNGDAVSAIHVTVGTTVTCTFTNTAKATLIVKKVTSDGSGTFNFTSSTLTPNAFSLTTTGAGEAGSANTGTAYADILPGTYDVAETVPANWNLTSSSCSDSSPVTAIVLSAGETVTCTFTNARERGAIDITKLYKHAASGSSAFIAQQGVTFTVSGGDLSTPITAVTGADGHACVPGLLVSTLAGNYTVTETVPTGYHNVDQAGITRTGVAVTESTCASGAASLTFHNMPLTNITVSVNSQVDGGTGSTIDCDPVTPGVDATVPATAPDNGDGSYTKSNLEPGTYTCTIVVDP